MNATDFTVILSLLLSRMVNEIQFEMCALSIMQECNNYIQLEGCMYVVIYTHTEHNISPLNIEIHRTWSIVVHGYHAFLLSSIPIDHTCNNESKVKECIILAITRREIGS